MTRKVMKKKKMLQNQILKKKKNIIKDIVNFHKEWSKNKIIDDDVQTFTVREIAAVMKALGDGRDPFETMLIIYGARYLKEKKEKMIKILRKKSGVDIILLENLVKILNSIRNGII